jgi:hypothetical protein
MISINDILYIVEIIQFFHSGETTLCSWHSHLQVQDFVRAALCQATGLEGVQQPIHDFDPLIIYTDGSSKPSNRRKAPLWVQDHGVPDAWHLNLLSLAKNMGAAKLRRRSPSLGGMLNQFCTGLLCPIL